jgi:peptidoglycan/xylan/chitin deacetylase (PgdA/CDA1 family)
MSHRAYGNRIGVFRLVEVLDRLGIPATVAIDVETAENFPFLASFFRERGDEFIARGQSASRMITSLMSEADERAHILECLQRLQAALGQAPAGWFGPQYGESASTPKLLAAAGVEYVCDWVNDEQPYRMDTGMGPLHVLPVCLDFDDDVIFRQWHHQFDWYERTLREAFDVLYAEGERAGRTLVVNVSPWLMGQPFRVGAFESAMQHIMSHPHVWATPAAQIVRHFRDTDAASNGLNVTEEGGRSC